MNNSFRWNTTISLFFILIKLAQLGDLCTYMRATKEQVSILLYTNYFTKVTELHTISLKTQTQKYVKKIMFRWVKHIT